MKHFDVTLKVYAKQGLRSAEEWKTLGRDIILDSAPRTDAASRGKTIGLFSRDQTQAQPPSQRLKR